VIQAEQGDYSAGPRIHHQANARRDAQNPRGDPQRQFSQRPGSQKMKRVAPTFLATRQREQQHSIEQLGPKLRAMMPFLPAGDRARTRKQSGRVEKISSDRSTCTQPHTSG